jgi:hypothetical protein
MTDHFLTVYFGINQVHWPLLLFFACEQDSHGGFLDRSFCQSAVPAASDKNGAMSHLQLPIVLAGAPQIAFSDHVAARHSDPSPARDNSRRHSFSSGI